MAKYNSQQLQLMAQSVLRDASKEGDKSFTLIMKVASRTGLSPNEVKNRIKLMAEGTYWRRYGR